MQNNSGPQANARQTCTETRKEEDHDHCRVIEQQRNDQSDGCAALAVMARQPASDSQGEQGAPATCCSPPPDHNPSTVIYDAVQCLDYQQLAELTDLYLHPAWEIWDGGIIPVGSISRPQLKIG
jgi:hypothetical protein